MSQETLKGCYVILECSSKRLGMGKHSVGSGTVSEAVLLMRCSWALEIWEKELRTESGQTLALVNGSS
jgi:hypothetical protein